MEFTQIKESCLYIHDLESAKKFYHGILGLSLVDYAEGRHLFMRVGPSMLLCFNPDKTIHEKELPPHYAKGNQHIAFECAKESYEAWKSKILSSGIPVEHEASWGKSYRSFYFRDPEENVLEIVQPGMWD